MLTQKNVASSFDRGQIRLMKKRKAIAINQRPSIMLQAIDKANKFIDNGLGRNDQNGLCPKSAPLGRFN
jgi:hypothetical protein